MMHTHFNIDGFNIVSVNEIFKFTIKLENNTTGDIYEQCFERAYILYPFQTPTNMYNFIAYPPTSTVYQIIKLEPENKLIFRIKQATGVSYEIKFKKLIQKIDTKNVLV